MRAAYLFHLVNLAVSVLMVPVLLGGLSVADYAIWLAFVAFGNATIQVQNAVQTVVIKDIARAYYSGNAVLFGAARRRTRLAYLALASLVVGPVMAAGLVYFHAIGASADVSRVTFAWIVFVLAYALVYLCAPRNAVLIGTGRVDLQNNINTLTRVIQLVGVATAMGAGFGILGLCIAFAAATSTGSILSATAARRIAVPVDGNVTVDVGALPPKSRILRYIGFAAASYGLYNGMYLAVAAQVPRDIAASYGLGIQIATLLMAIATAPFNVWLGSLTRAVADNDRDAVVTEVSRTFLIANAVFIIGFAGLILLGPWLLDLIGAAMRLPDDRYLALIGVAFSIEANILVLVNYLMVRGDFSFVRPYVLGAAIGATLGVVMARESGNPYAFVALPALVQGLVALPMLVRRVRPLLGGGLELLARSGSVAVTAMLMRHLPSRHR